jgi:NAD(P)-dependent dehydrogenase (short-subunit alcohol dehydrogenase family)
MSELASSKPTRTAIITGASSGIGLEMAKTLLSRGYHVVATSRNISASNALDSTKDLALVTGDIADRTTAQSLIATAVERFGSVDLLVNNAGVFVSKPFTEYSVEDFRGTTRTNLDGFFHVSQLAVAQMVKQGAGHVVNITASVVDQPIAGFPSVLANLTKGGLQAATRALAIEFASAGLRFNAIAPGVVKTPMHPAATEDFLKQRSPVDRMVEISDIVDALLYLESAPSVNGETLHVDGGAHAGKW